MKALTFDFLTITILFSSLIWSGESISKKEKADNYFGTSKSINDSYFIDVKALDYAFGMPEEIKSGWVTFRMENLGTEEHAALIMPATDSLDFGAAKDLVKEAIKLGTDRDWHFSSLSHGRSPEFEVLSPVSPSHTGQTTVHLDPGVYFMWCPLETSKGVIHDQKGMVTAFRVINGPVQTQKPEADTEITLSAWAISTDGPVGAGHHTFSVRSVGDPYPYLQLARLKKTQTIEDVAAWLASRHHGGSSPFEFVGGTGGTSESCFFSVMLKPGRYALVSPFSGVAGSRAEIIIPQKGMAPAISPEPVNPPVELSFPGTDSIIPLPSGRTLVTLENRSDSVSLDFVKLRKGFTEKEFYTFWKPAGLGDRIREASFDSIPQFGLAYDLPEAGERKEFSIDLPKGTYFLVPFIREHYSGKRSLNDSEMDMIQKIMVQ
ncbi:hypothetical protein C7S20_03590 [Christiangramia fulva]|uniref:Uncharacterized protein n=1 Tax=Christiangramia fulva TaxID=2126553 RepID=A0A2R3Z2B2_9FLAO|nr:hypothetical protein [Christiangramia fulva]AVR44413.1 hypothetical protein C7S20_03590 [Christiangramia fulva]